MPYASLLSQLLLMKDSCFYVVRFVRMMKRAAAPSLYGQREQQCGVTARPDPHTPHGSRSLNYKQKVQLL